MILEQVLFLSAAALYLTAVLLNARRAYAPSQGRAGDALLAAGAAVQLAGLTLRTVAGGHAPFANTYESLVFYTWCLVVLWLLLSLKGRNPVVSALIGLIAFLGLGLASVLPESGRILKPLVPALQSVWLVVHVVTSFVGYAGFGVAFTASLLFLARYYRPAGRIAPDSSFSDSLSYRAVAVGFTFLTIGILTGAVWAKHAWGRYWSWDPKETWALVTWLIYSFHLHSRLVNRPSAALGHWISLAGFIAVLFTYFGVNYLMTGLHSYR